MIIIFERLKYYICLVGIYNTRARNVWQWKRVHSSVNRMDVSFCSCWHFRGLFTLRSVFKIFNNKVTAWNDNTNSLFTIVITLLCKYSQITLMQMNLIPESPQAVICNQSKLNKYQETLNNIIETLINNVYTWYHIKIMAYHTRLHNNILIFNTYTLNNFLSKIS